MSERDWASRDGKYAAQYGGIIVYLAASAEPHRGASNVYGLYTMAAAISMAIRPAASVGAV